MPSSEEIPTPADQDFDDARSHPNPRLCLSNEQEKLHRELCRLQSQLGAMYLGGLQVLEHEANPDRLAQSAHSMRELMDRIVKLLETPVGEGRAKGVPAVSLNAKVIEIEDLFLRGKARTGSYSNELGWEGCIDEHLRKLLEKMNAFFEWFARLHPRRRERVRRTLRRLDGSGRNLPGPFLEQHRKEWEGIRNFFLSVCHHGKRADIDELRDRITALESFLADRLVPSTLDDLDAIDALLEETGDA